MFLVTDLQGLTSVPVTVETEHTIPLMAFSNAKVFMGHMFIAVVQVVRVVTGSRLPMFRTSRSPV